jgi:thiamine phosphate synthase YjbQ (UPF0047 family)
MVRHSLSLSTQTRRQFLDLTSPVREQVARAEVTDGLVVVNTMLSAGELCLGRFQSILFVEWDGPRTRSIDIQSMGA